MAKVGQYLLRGRHRFDSWVPCAYVPCAVTYWAIPRW